MKSFSAVLLAIVAIVALACTGFAFAQNDEDDEPGFTVPDVYELVEVPDKELKTNSYSCYTFVRKLPATDSLEFKVKATDGGGELIEKRDQAVRTTNLIFRRDGSKREAVFACAFARAGRGEIEVWSNGKKVKTIKVVATGPVKLQVEFKKPLTEVERQKAFPGYQVVRIAQTKSPGAYQVILVSDLTAAELSKLVEKLPEVKRASPWVPKAK